MRIFRMICILLLGVVIGFLVLYASGWRRPVPPLPPPPVIPAVWLVTPVTPMAGPVLTQGEVLKWRGVKDGDPFNVQFTYGGPCGSAPIPSNDIDEPGVQVATCTVGVVNPASRYGYTVTPKTVHGPRTQFPCPGCQFFPVNPPSFAPDVHTRKTTDPFDAAGVGCNPNTAEFDVLNPNQTDTHPATVNKPVYWVPFGATTSFTISFDPGDAGSISCNPDPKNPIGGTACTFSVKKKYKYTAKDGDNTVCKNPSTPAYVDVK